MDDDDDEVGYGKPPKRHRFQKGTSGNPRGRRKKQPVLSTFAEIAKRELDAPIQVKQNGKTTRVTMREALVKTAMERASRGDKAAFQIMMTLDEQAPPSHSFSSHEEEEAELAKIMQELASVPLKKQEQE